MAASASPPVVVLTGGIASGKSAVSERLAELGVQVIDTDVLARQAVEPGSPGLTAVVQTFGPEVLAQDGSLDRKHLRRRVFDDPKARERLEKLLHPRIESAAREQLRRLDNSPYCLLVVPLLVETGLFRDADCVVVVDVPESVQRARLVQRDEVDEKTANGMLASQASREKRLARADEVIDNQGSLDELRTRVDDLHERLLARFDTGTRDRSEGQSS